MEKAGIVNTDTEALRLIECGKYRVLSLDVFDTTVWRTFPAPTDLFYSLGSYLQAAGILFPSVSPASFAGERLEAEKTARSILGRNGEVTLREIYENFPTGLLRAGIAEDLLKAELDLERRSTYTDPGIAALIERAIQRGLQIAFVSDTCVEWVTRSAKRSASRRRSWRAYDLI